MALGTGPEALVDLIQTEWQQFRNGRGDVPPMIYQNPRQNKGVIVTHNREDVFVDKGKHDLIHCYHPEGAPPVETDQGYKEKNVVETVQIDIELTDRTDHTRAAGNQRLSARERMVGDREDIGDTSEAPYPGIWGEVRYILETVRRGYEEWDTVSQTPVNVYLGNSNADVSLSVELERIATNTVQ